MEVAVTPRVLVLAWSGGTGRLAASLVGAAPAGVKAAMVHAPARQSAHTEVLIPRRPIGHDDSVTATRAAGARRRARAGG